MAKIKKQSNLSKFLSQHRSYLIGILLGVGLILLNTLVGLYMVNIVVQSENPQIKSVQSLPVPAINESAYKNFKDDYLDRKIKDLVEAPSKNPFQTDK
jgi:hypothetical protein